MWLSDQVLYPRFLRSLIWMILLHYVFVNGCFLLIKMISWHPLSSITEWMLCLFHWRIILYLCILSASIAAFGILNIRFSAVEKHINSTRFEKICRALSPYCLQHVFCTMALGGLVAYCYDNLFHNFLYGTSFMHSWLSSENDFEQSFIIGHGSFTGMMFSLKYFICNMYLIKFTLDQESKLHYIKHQIYDQMKESFFCVLKAVYWYYLAYIFGSPLKILTLFHIANVQSETGNMIYNLINIKLFCACIISGVMLSFTWSLYLVIFNAFATEHHKFPIKAPSGKHKTLSCALGSKESGYLKYLAVLDLRLLSQFDPKRREHIYAISHPGGHPHEWKAISGVCISTLQDYVARLSEYSFATAAASESKLAPPKIPQLNGIAEKPLQSIPAKVFCYFQEKPAICYFFDELPNAKLMKLFASSQPIIWIVDALGFLVSFSYSEDQYGVVQQILPEVIRLLLDIKMAEEKMPVGLVGIRTYVKDPQGRYEHIHQRLLLKSTVNNALCRIANTFKEDIAGIYLPEAYQKYFQRYLVQKS